MGCGASKAIPDSETDAKEKMLGDGEIDESSLSLAGKSSLEEKMGDEGVEHPLSPSQNKEMGDKGPGDRKRNEEEGELRQEEADDKDRKECEEDDESGQEDDSDDGNSGSTDDRKCGGEGSDSDDDDDADDDDDDDEDYNDYCFDESGRRIWPQDVLFTDPVPDEILATLPAEGALTVRKILMVYTSPQHYEEEGREEQEGDYDKTDEEHQLVDEIVQTLSDDALTWLLSFMEKYAEFVGELIIPSVYSRPIAIQEQYLRFEGDSEIAFVKEALVLLNSDSVSFSTKRSICNLNWSREDDHREFLEAVEPALSYYPSDKVEKYHHTFLDEAVSCLGHISRVEGYLAAVWDLTWKKLRSSDWKEIVAGLDLSMRLDWPENTLPQEFLDLMLIQLKSSEDVLVASILNCLLGAHKRGAQLGSDGQDRLFLDHVLQNMGGSIKIQTLKWKFLYASDIEMEDRDRMIELAKEILCNRRATSEEECELKAAASSWFHLLEDDDPQLVQLRSVTYAWLDLYLSSSGSELFLEAEARIVAQAVVSVLRVVDGTAALVKILRFDTRQKIIQNVLYHISSYRALESLEDRDLAELDGALVEAMQRLAMFEKAERSDNFLQIVVASLKSGRELPASVAHCLSTLPSGLQKGMGDILLTVGKYKPELLVGLDLAEMCRIMCESSDSELLEVVWTLGNVNTKAVADGIMATKEQNRDAFIAKTFYKVYSCLKYNEEKDMQMYYLGLFKTVGELHLRGYKSKKYPLLAGEFCKFVAKVTPHEACELREAAAFMVQSMATPPNPFEKMDKEEKEDVEFIRSLLVDVSEMGTMTKSALKLH